MEKVSQILTQEKNIQNWQVDTDNPDKTLMVRGKNMQESRIIQLVQQAGFQASRAEKITRQKKSFWKDQKHWKRASWNTLNCLIGCSIGDFGMIIFLQAQHPQTALTIQMLLAIVAGLCTSILLETIILRVKEHFQWKEAFYTAFSMSFISMVGMELAMNTTDFMITGGQADFKKPVYWLALASALIAGFFAPLPYNYYKLKKFNKTCH